MADRFLDIDVGTGPHRRDRDERVPMIRSGHDDDLRLFTLQQLAVVRVGIRFVAGFLLDPIPGREEESLVDVAERNDL